MWRRHCVTELAKQELPTFLRPMGARGESFSLSESSGARELFHSLRKSSKGRRTFLGFRSTPSSEELVELATVSPRFDAEDPLCLDGDLAGDTAAPFTLQMFLCPAFQSAAWQAVVQYRTILQREHRSFAFFPQSALLQTYSGLLVLAFLDGVGLRISAFDIELTFPPGWVLISSGCVAITLPTLAGDLWGRWRNLGFRGPNLRLRRTNENKRDVNRQVTRRKPERTPKLSFLYPAVALIISDHCPKIPKRPDSLAVVKRKESRGRGMRYAGSRVLHESALPRHDPSKRCRLGGLLGRTGPCANLASSPEVLASVPSLFSWGMLGHAGETRRSKTRSK